MGTLILTGWGWKDYAGAAAAALRFWKKAKIMGISTRRLPEFMNEQAKVPTFKRIAILGVGLTGETELLLKSVKTLKQKGIAISWISILELPVHLSEIRDYLEISDESNFDSLTEKVGDIYRIDVKDLLPLIHEGNKSLPAHIRDWHMLLEAGMYFYRNYQDMIPFAKIIEHMAFLPANKDFSKEENAWLDHYKRFGHRELVGGSDAMAALQEMINRVAVRDDARVMIHGETGTGKETVALQIHNKSPRRKEPFIAFNCATVNKELLESRFFGYVKGAFTGANETRDGLFKKADGGTLFLDEIGELQLELQGLLLRVLEVGRFSRVGETEEIPVDVRLITATHCNLPEMVRAGKFRADLFHRLNVIPIRVPALRNHLDDIEKIANGYWMRQHRRRLEPEQIAALKKYDWPGNVRELFNILERASVLDERDFDKLLTEHRSMVSGMIRETVKTYPDNLDAMTRLHVKNVYDKCGGNISHAAEAMAITRNTLKKYLNEEM